MRANANLIFLPLLLVSPQSCKGFLPFIGAREMSRSFATRESRAATNSLPPLLDASGADTSPESISSRLDNKRVALYFAAGWCPMCTAFEPSLLKFRDSSEESGKPVEIIYVPSDRSASEQAKRASSMGMWSVPFGEEADNMKLKYKVWSGAEAIKFGFGRRSGVPALVVLDKENGEEMEFIPAESQGASALQFWPLDDERGIWSL